MVFYSDANWEELGISEEHHKLFFLNWEELFSEETYDSWQVRTVNLRYILMEMNDALDVALSFPSSHKNIDMLIAESIEVAKNDTIIHSNFHFVKSYIDKLRQIYDGKIATNDKNVGIYEFKKIVSVIIQNTSNYKELLIEKLKDIISRPFRDNKRELLKLIMALGIQLKSDGYSIAYLRDSLKYLKNKDITNFIDRFNTLISIFSSDEKEYECSFFIVFPGDKTETNQYGMLFVNEKPDSLLSEEEERFYLQDSDPSHIVITVSALDPFSARVKAEKKAENIFAACNFYQPNKMPKFKHKLSLISHVGGTEKNCIDSDKSRLNYIRDSRKPGQSISLLMLILADIKDEDSGKLTASLQYHRLSMIAHTDEARLVNLWIAMESLLQGNPGSIIEKICKFIPVSLSLEYVLQTMKNLAIAMRGVWRQPDNRALLADLKYSDRYQLNPIDLLSILLSNAQDNRVTKITEMLSANPLLRNRIYILHENMFKSPKNLSKTLKNHQKNIKWQLCRIYRARNYVMHRGTCPPKIRQLIQHLHSYYILTLHSIIHDLKSNSGWGVSEAFENTFQLYNYMLELLQKSSNNTLTVEEILYPRRLLLKKSNPRSTYAWPAT